METQKNIKEPKGNGPAASKAAGGRKQPGAAAAATPSQGATQGGDQGREQGAAQGGTGEKAGGQDLLQQAKQTTGEIVNQVQQRAGSQISQQKESAASDLSTVVDAVRKFGESLSNEGSGPIARYAAQYGDKAADKLERLTTYIREQDPKQLLDDVQNFGRRRPAWLLGGAFILGFAGARLIKSSLEAASQHQEFSSGAMKPNLPAPKPTPNVPAPKPSTATPNVR